MNLKFAALALCLSMTATAFAGVDDKASPAVMPTGATPVTLDHSAQWDMQATDSHRAYRIFVSLPDKPAPAGGYAVLYVLDGNAMFLTTVEAVRAYERRPDAAGGPGPAPTVVVGIGYPPGTNIAVERTLDLTPVATTDKRVRAPGGGADAFLDFILKQVKPAVERMTRIDQGRQALLGHSFGGLFTLHTLATRPQSFQTYVAASASLWYADKAVVKELDAFTAKRAKTAAPVRVLLTAGEYEGTPAPWAGNRGPDSETSLKAMNQLGNAREMVSLLDKTPGVTARFEELLGEDHGSVILVAIGRGVRFMETATLGVAAAPPVPSAQAYFAMTPEQRYRLRMQVRDLPDAQRIPWLNQLKQTLHDGLTKEQQETLHRERDQMDANHGTEPRAVNAQ